MAKFWTDSIALCCTNVPACQQWWINYFESTSVAVPEDWDNTLPSDVALKLPSNDEPAILLSNLTEVKAAGYDRSNERAIVFCAKLNLAYEYLQGRGATPGPIQTAGDVKFFELRDPEGNVIEICEEP